MQDLTGFTTTQTKTYPAGTNISDGLRVGSVSISGVGGIGILTSPFFRYQVTPQPIASIATIPVGAITQNSSLTFTNNYPTQTLSNGVTVVALDCPRTVVFNYLGGTLNQQTTFAVNGYDYQFQPMTENIIANPDNAIICGQKAFAYIKSIIPITAGSTLATSALAVTTSDFIGLPYPIVNENNVRASYYDTIQSAYEGYLQFDNGDVTVSTPIITSAFIAAPPPGSYIQTTFISGNSSTETITSNTSTEGEITFTSSNVNSTATFYWRFNNGSGGLYGTNNSLINLMSGNFTVSGTETTITIDTPYVQTTSNIVITTNGLEDGQNLPYISGIINSTSFTIANLVGDASYNWTILNPSLVLVNNQANNFGQNSGTVFVADKTNPATATTGDVRGVIFLNEQADGAKLFTADIYLNSVDSNYNLISNQSSTSIQGIAQYYNPAYF